MEKSGNPKAKSLSEHGGRLKSETSARLPHLHNDESNRLTDEENIKEKYPTAENSGAVILFVDIQNETVSIEKCYGYISLEKIFQLQKLPLEENILASLPPSFTDQLFEAIQTSSPRQFNWFNTTNGNPLRIADLYIIPIESNKVIVNLKDLSIISNSLESLNQSRENIKQLQDNLPIGLFQISEQGEFLYVNNWTVKILGYKTSDDLIQQPVSQWFSSSEAWEKIAEKLAKQGGIKDMEVQLNRKNGDNIWVVISVNKVISVEQPKASYDGYVYDITERKNALENLRDSEEMFRVISQNLRSVLYLFNEEGQFIYANNMVQDVTGYSRDELLSKKFFEIVHPDYRELVKDRGLKRLKGSRIPKSYEFKIITKSGEEKWLEIFATRMQFKGQNVILGLANDITDRQETLKAIKDSNEKYKSLYSFFRLMADNVPDMIWAKDRSNNYIFANKSLCDNLLMAKNIEEPIGKDDMFFANRERKKKPEDPDWHTFGENMITSDEIVLKNHKSQHFHEYGNIKGRFLFLDVHKSPLIDEEGNLIGTVGSARDVTATKQMEREREKEEKIRNVVFRIGNAVNSTKDLAELFTVIRFELSELIDTTNLYIALYNKEKEEISLPYFIDEKDRFKAFPARRTLTHYLIKNNRPMLLREKDYKELANKGEIELTGSLAKVWLGVPLTIKGETIGALVVQNYGDENAFNEEDLELLKFISFQVSTTINQKIADDSLRESEFALRQIIDNVPVMIFAKDKHLRFVLANKALADMYGLRVDQIEGRLQSDIHQEKEEFEKFMNDDYTVIDKGIVKLIKEEPFTDKDGNVRILQTTKIPMKTGMDSGIAMLGVAIDITDRIESEEELKKAKNKAEESDRLKTAFLANMSHEIRTPMNAIIGFSELLNDPELSSDDRKEFIKLIGENSKVLLKLIEDIIDVAKIEAEQIKIVRSSCHVNQIIEELIVYYSNFLKRYEHKNIRILFNTKESSSDFGIITDPLRFKQILNNLIGNAIKFTEKGEVEIGYTVQNEKRIVFYVRDTGIGLASDKMKLIFERFRQVEESSTKEYGGTGLGLTISRRLVELLGGNIWVESVLHEGSTFYFSLPFEKTSITNNHRVNLTLTGKRDWTGKTILVAEDESSNFELINATLQTTNINVLRANNGIEAVEICKKGHPINLILMDIRMPEMDGYEATRHIKKMFPNMPVVSLTAYAMAEDREKSFHAGCNEYISKPFNPIDLLNKIDKYMV
ncbi:MAG: PAS domain S-box protein [Bacteroidales bacterium]|nr:PAS domain S-box protein [Bacteroidales bacterium]